MRTLRHVLKTANEPQLGSLRWDRAVAALVNLRSWVADDPVIEEAIVVLAGHLNALQARQSRREDISGALEAADAALASLAAVLRSARPSGKAESLGEAWF